MKLKEFTTHSGETILYNGNPDLQQLEFLSKGSGDIWHSSLDQGYRNLFPEIVYQTATFWYINDYENLSLCVSWRINSSQFAIRKSVWESLNGFDVDFETGTMQGLDLGYRALKSGGIPLHVKGLFLADTEFITPISVQDRYVFYRKKYKIDHALLMLFRKGIFNWKEWNALIFVAKHFKIEKNTPYLAPRKLNSVEGNPTISYIIPTMLRQDFTMNLLKDLSKQEYLPTEVIIVDATPVEKRNLEIYNFESLPFEVKLVWQITKGSCRARNEAIALCTGDYIVFGDDDIRIPQNFIANHIRFLQTYKVDACNGLDIRADHENQNLDDLHEKIRKLSKASFKAGCALMFSNANSCVSSEFVHKLVGNDVNFDGGYGEDSDFGMSLSKAGAIVLSNPFSVNLHLKPPAGGYRFWGNESKILGKKRKKQPWELDTPVKWIRPVPSPTIVYGIQKQFTTQQLKEYRYKYFFLFLFKGKKRTFVFRLLKLPLKIMQFKKSLFYASELNKLGTRYT
ncbi:glycosyltransferase family 2 protein [Flavobacterium agrisoli]|uniref:Glycosyltransferase n=1 Tax=Flavobacterium agrisoli TaxID=2793066 RepID=A0A934UK63_9FLAO|nr:glycosyltransferase [Flavobacterium agrisoli]MBK0370726.1 glycosyltransferase [Flavobacterium agrisoli]